MRAEALEQGQAWCGLGAARAAGQWEAGHREPRRACRGLGGFIHTMRSHQWV